MSETLRLLIVDDNPGIVRTLVDILRLHDYQVEVSSSGFEGVEKVKAAQEAGLPFDCVLTDVRMPGMNGVEFQQAVRALQPELPVVLMTAYTRDRIIEDALGTGAMGVLNKPLDLSLLLSFFGNLGTNCEVVIVDDDPGFRRTMGDLLQREGYAVAGVSDPLVWVRDFQPEGCQMVLLDLKLNGIDGLDILKRLKARHPHLPVILVTGFPEQMAPSIQKSLEMTAMTCLEKPVDIEILTRHLRDAHRRNLSRMLEPLPRR